jgi:hypothetical protein
VLRPGSSPWELLTLLSFDHHQKTKENKQLTQLQSQEASTKLPTPHSETGEGSSLSLSGLLLFKWGHLTAIKGKKICK